jgi:signal peptidase I
MTEPYEPSSASRPAEPVASSEPVATDTTERLAPAPPQEQPKSGSSFLRELPILIAVALVLALLIKAFLVQAFYIPSESMEDTLHVKDRVLVNKLVYHTRSIHRGEIVVFNGKDTSFEPEVSTTTPSNPIAKFFRSIGTAVGIAPPGEKDFIKRVIGVGGDHVVCCDATGHVTVNGVALNETYIKPGVKPSETTFDVTVPKGHLWVMGDNRSNSQDSRAHISDADHGFIPTHKVIGRAFIKVWPVSHFGVLHVPKTFQQKALQGLAAPFGGGPTLALGLVGALPVLPLRRRLRARRRISRGATRADGPVVP